MKGKTILLLIVFLCFAIVVGFGILLYVTLDTVSIFEGPMQYNATDDVTIYFAPSEETISALVGIVNTSKQEVHCALRSLNFLELEQTFAELEESGVRVRIFVDYDYIGNQRIKRPYIVFSDRREYGSMHNNFCVIDGREVLTGSLIFNQNTLDKNFHDMMHIRSQDVAGQYSSEFWKLYQNQSESVSDAPETVLLRTGTAQSAFCPRNDCRSLLINTIEKAKVSVDFATYTFSDPEVIEALKRAEQRGVVVRGVVDANGVEEFSVVQHNFDHVRVHRDVFRVHTKIFVIDEQVVVTGSTNPTPTGFERNDENMFVIDNRQVGQDYTKVLDRII